MAFTEDLSLFYDTEGFAVEASFKHGSGSAVTIRGIFDNAYYAVDTQAEVDIACTQPRFQCATSSVASAAEGDKLTLDGVEYTIIDIQPDGTGVTMLILQKP